MDESGYTASGSDSEDESSVTPVTDIEETETLNHRTSTSLKNGWTRQQRRRYNRQRRDDFKDSELSGAETDTMSQARLGGAACTMTSQPQGQTQRVEACPRAYGYISNGKQKIQIRLLFDTGSTHDIICADLAATLRLEPDPQLGPRSLLGAHPDHAVECSGMLRNVHIQLPSTVKGEKLNMAQNFLVSRISCADVVLGMPWWNKYKANLIYPADDEARPSSEIRVLLPAVGEARIPLKVSSVCSRPTLLESTKGLRKLIQRGCQIFQVSMEDIKSEVDSGCLQEVDASINAIDENSPTRPPIPLSGEDIARAMEEVRADTATYPNAEKLTASLINEFKDVFGSPYDLPPKRAFDHVIDTEGRSPPKSRRVPRFSLAELEIVRDWLKDMVNKGWMVPSRSPYGAPLLVVRKPGGGHRVVQDMRLLNKITKKASTPLPIFENLIVSFSGSKFFSTMDMASFFFQIRLREQDCELTAVTTPYGLYEFRVTAMGLVNSPSTALLVMQDILRDYIGKDVGVFMDDIIVHSEEEDSHCNTLREILTIFREQRLHVSLRKCRFLRTNVAFLGHIVGVDGLRANPNKCAAIAKWPRPQTLTQLRAFLGLSSFYRRFIQGFADIAAPLTSLLTSTSGFPSTPFEKAWGERQEEAFVTLRQRLTTPPVLKLYDPSLPFVLRTDASEMAMGCALYQKHTDGTMHPIEFRSRKFSEVQRKYTAHDREFLAVLMAIRELRCYLRGVEFTLQTDNAAVAHVKTSRQLTSKYARWFDEFEEYACTIEHRPGVSMTDCDALSRRSGRQESQDETNDDALFDPDDRAYFYTTEGHIDYGILGNNVRDRFTSRDLQMLRSSAMKGRDRRHENNTGELQASTARRGKSTAKSLASWHHPSVGEWASAYDKDKDFSYLWNKGKGRPDSTGGVFRVVNNLLYKVETGLAGQRIRQAWQTPSKEWWRLCVPDTGTARRDYLRELHSAPLAGHRGRNATFDRARANLYWPKLSKDVEEYVKTCPQCQENKIDRAKPQGPARPLPVPNEPWSVISADWIGPLPATPMGYDMILVVVCHLSGQVHLIACRTTDDAMDTADIFFREIIRLHGIPHAIVSDRDTKFTSEFWSSLMQRLGTKLRMSTAFHPQSDGKTERFNAVVEEILRCYVSARQDDWDYWLSHVEFAINSSKSQTTHMTPFFINYGFEPKAPWIVTNPRAEKNDPSSAVYAMNLQAVHEFARDALQRAKDRQALTLNKRRRPVLAPFKVGGRVLLSTKHIDLRLTSAKLSSRYIGPFTVLKVGANTVTLDTPLAVLTQGKHNVFNVSCVRHYYDRPKRLFDVKDGPPKPFKVNGVLHWEMDCVIAKRMRGKHPEYLVVWKGYPMSECTWQPAQDIEPWDRALFDNRHPADGDGIIDCVDKPSSKSGTVQPVQIPLPLAPTITPTYNLRNPRKV